MKKNSNKNIDDGTSANQIYSNERVVTTPSEHYILTCCAHIQQYYLLFYAMLHGENFRGKFSMKI